ncbi:YtxH domain-containing protein [Chloroflexi bacterium CFX2]|jgi:gas vesicle protein|nr:YtxH domain-containing protein [Chloroflexi bacterium CFX2]
MIHDNQEISYRSKNVLGVFIGVLVGGLAGAITMLLLAPQSGKDTRMQIHKRGIELRDRTTEMVEDVMSQVQSSRDKLTMSGREKLQELKHQGQELVAEQLDHVSEVAQAGKKAIQGS